MPPESDSQNTRFDNISTLTYGATSKYVSTPLSMSSCEHCKDVCYWFEERMVVPAEAPAEPKHPDLPEDCVTEYDEAREIVARSPRAAAALLRLCIQKLMVHLDQKGENINDDIAALVKAGLDPTIQKALDICRVVGNNAVHPGQIDLNDTPEIAHDMFGLINFIVDDRITHPKKIRALYHKLPESSREAIEKRDGAST